ncbi:MAG TPA: M4 family metallopeptidase [Thermoanaerobaculia bacterium]
MNIGKLYALAGAVFVSLGAAHVHAQVVVPKVQSIPSLSEDGEQLAVQQISRHTGHVTFASSPGRGILLSLDPTAPAELRALKFLSTYGAAFGLRETSEMRLLRDPHTDALGLEHVRLQQTYGGVPIRAAEFIVHLDGSRVMVANGHLIDDFPATVMPSLPPAAAEQAARRLIEKHLSDRAQTALYSEPRLEILNRSLLSDRVGHHSRLAWFVEATGPSLRQFIWVDAELGVILLTFSQLAEGKSRQVYNGNHMSALPGTLVRSEGGAATGDADQDNAYTYAGLAYDYFFSTHGRDSFDGAGAVIKSTAHHCPEGQPQGTTCPSYENAQWTGSQMIYADGWASADDVVAHELAHAVTQYSADLLYYMQSGALNESFSDIFGETIDLLNGTGNDAANVRWKVGEELPGGAVRDMMNPTATPYFNPGKMSDSSYFICDDTGWTNPVGDHGGVHTNSGVPNHAYALMVDGGTYNDTTIAPIGLTKAAKVQYRALTVYLTSGSGFSDNYNALNQSCTDLLGTSGITASDCTQVALALLAVEMNHAWPCAGAAKAPPLCSSGMSINAFFDNFEAVTSNWTAMNGDGTWYTNTSGFAKGGTNSAWGTDTENTSDHRLAMTSSVAVPAGARLYFDHAFEFESGFFDYDGGVLEYSTNNGSTWNDAGSLVDAGQGYNGAILSGLGNPLGGRAGFVRSSYGYTGTRLNLGLLAGQSVRFRFRIGTDFSSGSLGWLVDNVTLYTCGFAASGSSTVVDDSGNTGTVHLSSESSSILGNGGVVLTDVARTANGALWGIDFSNLYSINSTTADLTFIGPLGVGGMNALVANGNGLLAASNLTTSLYSVNPATGLATALTGSLGYVSMGDLAFVGSTLYGAVQNGTFSDLVQITLSGNSFTATNRGHVTNDNALFGLATGADQNLYGFSGRSVLRINTANPPASAVVVADYGFDGGLSAANGASSSVYAAFTDDPLVARVTPIKPVHITQLRTRINAIRVARGLGSFSFTDPTLTSRSTRIKAVHVTELRTALAQAYAAASLTAPTYTDSSLAAKRIKTVHIMELRAAVKVME